MRQRRHQQGSAPGAAARPARRPTPRVSPTSCMNGFLNPMLRASQPSRHTTASRAVRTGSSQALSGFAHPMPFSSGQQPERMLSDPKLVLYREVRRKPGVRPAIGSPAGADRDRSAGHQEPTLGLPAHPRGAAAPWLPGFRKLHRRVLRANGLQPPPRSAGVAAGLGDLQHPTAYERPSSSEAMSEVPHPTSYKADRTGPASGSSW